MPDKSANAEKTAQKLIESPIIYGQKHSEDLPAIQLRIQETDRDKLLYSGAFRWRGIRSKADQIVVARRLLRNGTLNLQILKEAQKLEAKHAKEQAEIKKQTEIEEQKRVEERKAQNWEIKNLITYRHVRGYTKKALNMIRKLTVEERQRLQEQVERGEHPARWSQEDKEFITLFLEGLKEPETQENPKKTLEKIVGLFRGH